VTEELKHGEILCSCGCGIAFKPLADPLYRAALGGPTQRYVNVAHRQAANNRRQKAKRDAKKARVR
jgi:hypothetical protein